MQNTLQNPVTSWAQFQTRWDGMRNFLMQGEVVPFAFHMPPLDRVVEELRRDEMASIGPGTRGDRLLLEECSAAFRALSIEQALESSFSLAHFRLSRFDAPGRFLHGFAAQVLEPWQAALRAAGFTFDRCYPIIFISGKGCATNYHMDFSHVLAWQIYGTKRFCGLRDPDRWAPRDVRLNYRPGAFTRPAALTDADSLCFDMRPGDVLWNMLLTPHWVEAGDEVALSVNISHGGLRYQGQLCPFEQELEDYRREHPERAPQRVLGVY